MKKNQIYQNKGYWKRGVGEAREKWGHESYEELIRETGKSDHSPQNYHFKKKRDDYFPYRKEDYSSKQYYKSSETQMLKCYSKKQDSKPSSQDSLALPLAEKPEKGKEEKELGLLEEKLSNVSTSFSSKEKPWEEDITTPKLQNGSRRSEGNGAKALVTINLTIQYEPISIEIFKEDEIEDKLSEITINHMNRGIDTLATRIFLLYQIQLAKVFPEPVVSSLLDKQLELYEKVKLGCIGTIDEVNDEEL